jgi:phosphate-selective porin OprO and OprP
MNKIILLGTAAMVAASFTAAPAFAERKASANRDAEIQELKARIEKLEAESADETIEKNARLARLEKLTDDVQWSFADLRPTVRTGDGRFELAFRGRVQADFASFEQDPNDFGLGYGPAGICNTTNQLCDQGSGAVIRRARFGVEGKFFTNFIYEFRWDFGGSGAEAAGLNIGRVGYIGVPGLRIHAGVIQPVMTMYDATSSAELTTMERAQVITTLVGAYGGDSARRGIEATYQKESLLWDGDNFIISAAFTGDRVGTGHSTGVGNNDESSHAIGRLAYRLFSDGTNNVQIGGTYAAILDDQDNTINLQERPEIRVDGDRFIGTGNITATSGDAYGFEFGANFENLYLAAEWYEMTVDALNPAHRDPSFSGWYVEGEWILTGENKRYAAAATNNNLGVFRGPSVSSPWSPGGGIGAWSLHARYSTLDLNDEVTAANAAAVAGQDYRGGAQTITNIGLTWYVNANLKMMGEYAMVEIDRNGTGALQADSLDAEFDILQSRLMFTF